MEFAKQRFGFDATHVPYRNTGQSVTDLAAGQVDAGFVEAGASMPLIKDGKLRALAVSSVDRLPLLPDVPPFAEAAEAPDFEAVSWHMLLAPAKTPRPIVDRLHAEMKKIMNDPAMTEKAAAIGLIPIETPSIEGMQRLHQVRARQVGRAGREARPEGHAVAALAEWPGRLQDKVALVTGAGCVGPGWGNGRATAVRFAQEGAKVFAVDKNARGDEGDASRACREFGGDDRDRTNAT